MFSSATSQALSDKCDGHSNEAILASLVEQGIPETEATDIIKQLGAIGKKKLEAARNSLLVGLYFVLGGIGLRMIMRSDMEQTLLNIVTATLVISGLLKIADGWFKQGRYKWAKPGEKNT